LGYRTSPEDLRDLFKRCAFLFFGRVFVELTVSSPVDTVKLVMSTFPSTLRLGYVSTQARSQLMNTNTTKGSKCSSPGTLTGCQRICFRALLQEGRCRGGRAQAGWHQARHSGPDATPVISASCLILALPVSFAFANAVLHLLTPETA
jgi:hypothetical protein